MFAINVFRLARVSFFWMVIFAAIIFAPTSAFSLESTASSALIKAYDDIRKNMNSFRGVKISAEKDLATINVKIEAASKDLTSARSHDNIRAVEAGELNLAKEIANEVILRREILRSGKNAMEANYRTLKELLKKIGPRPNLSTREMKELDDMFREAASENKTMKNILVSLKDFASQGETVDNKDMQNTLRDAVMKTIIAANSQGMSGNTMHVSAIQYAYEQMEKIKTAYISYTVVLRRLNNQSQILAMANSAAIVRGIGRSIDKDFDRIDAQIDQHNKMIREADQIDSSIEVLTSNNNDLAADREGTQKIWALARQN